MSCGALLPYFLLEVLLRQIQLHDALGHIDDAGILDVSVHVRPALVLIVCNQPIRKSSCLLKVIGPTESLISVHKHSYGRRGVLNPVFV